MTLRNAWKESVGSVPSCILFSARITIHSDSTQLVVASVIAAVIVLFLGAISFAMWRARAKIRELIFSVATFEGQLIAELCLEIWVLTAARNICCIRAIAAALNRSLQDFAGDATFVLAIRDYREKEWVGQLVRFLL